MAENQIYDVRVVEHHIRRGDASESNYSAHLDALVDDAADGEETRTHFASPFANRYFGPNAEPIQSDGQDEDSST